MTDEVEPPPETLVALRAMPAAASVRAQLVAALKQAIFSQHYKAGDRLSERALGELTGVSRTSLREAERQLEAEGLVALMPNKGPHVRRLTTAEARDIYDLRAVLEGHLAACAAQRAGPEEHRRMREILAELEGAAGQATIQAKTRLDDLLIALSGNRAIGEVLRMLHGRVNLLRSAMIQADGRRHDSLAEIRLMLDAIEAGDEVRARQAATRHARNAGVIAVQMLEDASRT